MANCKHTWVWLGYVQRNSRRVGVWKCTKCKERKEEK